MGKELRTINAVHTHVRRTKIQESNHHFIFVSHSSWQNMTLQIQCV